jgi:hypothetical protein
MSNILKNKQKISHENDIVSINTKTKFTWQKKIVQKWYIVIWINENPWCCIATFLQLSKNDAKNQTMVWNNY